MSEKQKPDTAALWDIIFRVMTVIILPWTVWATASIFQFHGFIKRGDRFSAKDGAELHRTILDESRKTRELIYQFEKEFSSDFVRHTELKTILQNNK